MPVLTVRRENGEDLTADTVLPRGDRLVVDSRDATTYVPLEDVRAIVAGEPADPEQPATDEGVVLA